MEEWYYRWWLAISRIVVAGANRAIDAAIARLRRKSLEQQAIEMEVRARKAKQDVVAVQRIVAAKRELDTANKVLRPVRRRRLMLVVLACMGLGFFLLVLLGTCE